MFCIANCCRFCLCKDKTIVQYTRLASDNVSYFKKIMDIAPKLVVDTQTYYPSGICKKCQEQVDQIHCFIQKCFKSKKILTTYITKLNAAAKDTVSFKTNEEIKTEGYTMTEETLPSSASNTSFIENEPIKEDNLVLPDFATDVVDDALLDTTGSISDGTRIKQEEIYFDDKDHGTDFAFIALNVEPNKMIPGKTESLSYDEEEKEFFSDEENFQSGFYPDYIEEPDKRNTGSIDNYGESNKITVPSQEVDNTDRFNSNESFLKMSNANDYNSPSIGDEEENTQCALLPEKSKSIYLKVYNVFKNWCVKNKVTEISENVLLIYFQEQAPIKKASSLWATFSMLKSTISLKENIDISKYSKLISFLKSQNTSYIPKKSAIFSKEEINKFLTQAPDEIFLSTKAILVIGLAGACRTDELVNMHMKDVDVRDDIIITNVPKGKNGSSRKFVLVEPLWIEVVKKYLGKRPTPDMPKVFIGFRNGKPTRQNIGHNTISRVPQTVATFLKLENAQNYTGRSLRRTSTILAESGGDILSLGQPEAWESASVAEDYVEVSIADKGATEIVQRPSTPSSNVSSVLTIDTDYKIPIPFPTCAASQPIPAESEIHNSTFNLSAENIASTSLNISSTHTSTTLDTETAGINLTCQNSKSLYLKVYSNFKNWCTMKNVAEITENVLLIYFQEQAPNKKASTLWATFSMLKSTISLKENIDISKYFKLIAFIKRQNISYKPKKSAIFSKEDIIKFLREAPDEIFLSTKAIFVMGLAGACRTDDLTNMQMKDIDVRDDIIITNIPKSKNGSSRKFVLVEPLWIDVVKKYLSNRPTPDMPKVFIGFRNGKPTRQNIGHNTISGVPKTVAKFLKLKNTQNFTGHSLRRTSATILAKNGGDVLSLK